MKPHKLLGDTDRTELVARAARKVLDGRKILPTISELVSMTMIVSDTLAQLEAIVEVADEMEKEAQAK